MRLLALEGVTVNNTFLVTYIDGSTKVVRNIGNSNSGIRKAIEDKKVLGYKRIRVDS